MVKKINQKNIDSKREGAGKVVIIILLILFALFLYSHFIGTKGLNIREYSVINNKLPDSFNGFKIVHFSDLGYGSNIFMNDVKKVVKNINSRKPDLVIFSGDLIDKNYKMRIVILIE